MGNKLTVGVKKLTDTAVLPRYGSEGAAGMDLSADMERPVFIDPGKTRLVSTGIAVAIPEGYFGALYARSGLAMKQGLRPANCVGVIDGDYRGPVGVALHNDSNEIRTVNPGDRIAQLVIQPYARAELKETDELPDTARGAGGFGSTGTN